VKKYKFDRTAFKASTAEEADKDMRDHKNLSRKRRLEIATYLISVAYNYDLNNRPKMDKNIFSLHKRQ
jgi:hypothetical protein